MENFAPTQSNPTRSGPLPFPTTGGDSHSRALRRIIAAARRILPLLLLCTPLAALISPACLGQFSPLVQGTSHGTPIDVRGRVVCLAEEFQKRYDADILADHEHQWGFLASNGTVYTLLNTRQSEALFLDERLRKMELILKGRVFPNSQVFEPVVIRSIKNGVVHDLYYYCVICSIKSITPRQCECCQEPVELVEIPLEGVSASRP
jgi:hypothetical protein